MTAIALCSIKGSPGVTTLATLLAGSWPRESGRRAIVVEADPAGGDIAGRFGLAAGVGWQSVRSAARRAGASVSLDEHLQRLPGGLDVLVAGRGSDVPTADDPVTLPLWSTVDDTVNILDLGRVRPGSEVDGWMTACRLTLVVARGSAADLLHLRAHGEWLRTVTGGSVAAVVVGRTRPLDEVAKFTEIRVLAHVPSDPRAAAVAGGSGGRTGRLFGSGLLAVACHLASELDAELAGCADSAPPADRSSHGPSVAAHSPRTTASTAPLRILAPQAWTSGRNGYADDDRSGR
mgnify:FL=1